MDSLLTKFPRIETTVLDEKIRSGQPGGFIRLPAGVTHYELAGPTDAPLVVLVHGFSIPYYLWDPTFKALRRAGLRVLRFDLFGRGASDRPAARYDLPFFVRQLDDLLAALGLGNRRLHLAGVSMGGPICLAYALHKPEAVKSICLVDPAGFDDPAGFSDRMLRLPGLGQLLFALQNRANVLDSLTVDLYHPERFPEYVEQYLPQLRYRGSVRALLSTLCSGALRAQPDLFRRFALTGLPTMLVWGENDLTFPFEISRGVLACLTEAEFLPVAKARHVPQYEHPEIVNPRLIDFIRRHDLSA